jgi:predicted permease
LNALLDILTHDILPIFIGIGLGFAFGRRFKPDVQTLSRVAFFIFSPALVFTSLVKSDLAGDELMRIAAFTAIVTLGMGGLGWLASRWLRLDARAAAALMLVCMFVNSGNYGLGVIQRAFGDEALARAVIYFTVSSLLVYTLGVSVAAGGNGKSVRAALRHIFEVPPVYAFIAAFIVRALSIEMTQPPLEPILAGFEIIARAAIPVLLIVLGIQLARTSVTQHLRAVLAASGLRLLVAPVLAWGLAGLIGLTGAARQASIVEASMPAAVLNIILATEYGANPALVSGAVVVSTLLSPITLSIVISLLK